MVKNVLRSVNTRFWNDSFVEDLTPSEKLLFLYLLTNPLTNILGVYEVSIKRISYDTGIPKETISKAFESFRTVKKVFYDDGFVILPNFIKNQNLNSNMMKGAINIFNNLPSSLRFRVLENENETLSKDSKGFERLSNTLGKYEREREREIEREIINDLPIIDKIDFNIFWNLYDKKTGKDKCECKWNNLKLEDQTKILEYIPKYKISQPDKKFRKNPETFLNNKSWNDEIIQNEDKAFAQKTNNNKLKNRTEKLKENTIEAARMLGLTNE